MRRIKTVRLVLATLVATGLLTSSPVRAQDCEKEFDSTWELIQATILENRGCTSRVCHGEAVSGGLDLRPEVAYRNLIDVSAETVDGWTRVRPGRKDLSLLFQNLAAKVDPDQYTAPLRAMPADPEPAILEDELEALRIWIESGAPETGVVEGTAELLDACLPDPEPIPIEPLPPPPPGEGLQIHMPRWILPPQSEREVCFASYYDVCDQIPDEFHGPDGESFRYKRNEVRQDNLSHHLIVNLYQGDAEPSDPAWGVFRCRGGEKDGQRCDPTDVGFCGAGSGCATTPELSVACTGFGPGDGGVGLNSAGISGTQETASELNFPEGVYRQLPCKGMIMWNSHAFNLSDVEGKLEAWLNFTYAAPEDQKWPAQQVFNTNHIFAMTVPPFEAEQVCATHVLPPDAHLYELSSHTHRHGKRFQTFRGRWTCESGPNQGQPCSPLGSAIADDICEGAPCTSTRRIRAGDCNMDGQVSVNELITAVNIALGNSTVDACREIDDDDDWQATITELVRAVGAAANGLPGTEPRDANESLLYVNLVYNDPVIERFDPPLVPGGDGTPGADRTLTFCSTYDNGVVDPSEVKRQSTSPEPPFNAPFPIGGPCDVPSACTEGLVGEPCSGDDAACDTAPGAGDGMCDACTLQGGVTTEDEMFILMGQYFVPN